MSVSFELLEDRLVPTAPLPDHLYTFTSGLADQFGGPALFSYGGVLGSDRYTFAANQGLRLTGALASTSTYSIAMRLELDSLNPFFKKLIDFSERTSDNGLYASGAQLQLYPGSGGPGNFAANTDFQVVLTRDGVSGQTKLYLNGVLQQTYTGADSSVAVPTTNVLNFFVDDSVTGFLEAVGGSVDFIAVYNVVLTAADAAEINAGLPTVFAGAGMVTVGEGSVAGNTGTWRDADFNVVSLTASVGTVTKNSNGTWSWSFATTDGPDQTQSVTIAATDSDGKIASTSFSLVVNNLPPAVSSDAATVTVNEGDTATNTGLWSDPGADTVSLAASVGTVTQNADGTWSWSWTTSDGPEDSQTVTITATDSDGASASTSFTLLVDNLPPAASSDAATVTVNEGDTATNTGLWSDPGADTVSLAASVGTVTQHADGTWSWSWTTSNGPEDSQTVTITATDDDGGSAFTSFDLVVLDVSPTVSADQSSVSVNEGDTASNTGHWTNSVSLSASIGTVIQNADGTWSWSWTTSDGPTDSQTVTITAINSGGATASATFDLFVSNVAPEITSLTSSNPTPSQASSDGAVSVTGTFSDAGVLDTHTVVINWGDGSSPETISGVNQESDSFAADHDYSSGGVYVVTVTVTDDDGDSATSTTSATVQGVGLVDGVLYVIGTNQKDIVRINVKDSASGPLIEVKTQFSVGAGSSVAYFPAGDVDSIVVDVRGGDDEVLLHSGVTARAFLLGGLGNDSLAAGGGASVLVGGSGDDQLRGGLGRDILIGGLGNDDLQGDPTSDLLVDGAAPQEGNLDALSAALAEWVAGNENGALDALGL